MSEAATAGQKLPPKVSGEKPGVGHMEEFDEELMHRIFHEGFRSVTPNGILGDARGATAEIGEACIAYAADGIVAALQA